ncbi:MAG TPA: oxidoreductase [Clostridiales bacterium]|nr:oxidoreductase [Clostridiales bacterium]
MKLGIIGCGNRVTGMAKLVLELAKDIELTAITDINPEKAKTTLSTRGLWNDNIRTYLDADQMLDQEELDGVMIGTRCSLHSTMGVKVLKRNLPMFIEKPVSTNMEDLLMLKKAYEESKSKVVVSFPLRVTPLAKLAKEIIDTGKLGTIEHVQAYNNVPYGGVYFHNWYRDENETGGLFLQKATHDFDYINNILNIDPVMVCAMRSKQIFKGSKPAGVYCKDCPEKDTCPEGPYSMKYVKFDNPNGDMCCFATDTGNEDSSSAIIRYSTGMHVNYTQNFFARKAAGTRGARFLGYNGTLEFDWYKDQLKVFMHNTPRVETYDVNSKTMSHGGGDSVLAFNFIDVMRKEAESVASLDAGLLSCLMCIKATKSAENNTFERIEF